VVRAREVPAAVGGSGVHDDDLHRLIDPLRADPLEAALEVPASILDRNED
jgi:hypothetical protein